MFNRKLTDRADARPVLTVVSETASSWRYYSQIAYGARAVINTDKACTICARGTNNEILPFFIDGNGDLTSGERLLSVGDNEMLIGMHDGRYTGRINLCDENGELLCPLSGTYRCELSRDHN